MCPPKLDILGGHLRDDRLHYLLILSFTHYLNAEGIELSFDGLLVNRWISELVLVKDPMLKKKKTGGDMYNIQEDITNFYYLPCFQWPTSSLKAGSRALWQKQRDDPPETSQ